MKKKHLREIERINKSIPKHLLDNLMKKEMAFPTVKEIMTRALTDPNVSEEDKAKYKMMLDSKYFDKEVEVLDESIESQINAYLDHEFEKARKLGRLPPPQKMPKLLSKSKKIYVQQSKDQSKTEGTQEV